MQRPENFTEKQILAAQALAAGCTWQQTARRANCAEESIRNWKRNPDFVDLIFEYQQQIFHQSFGITAAALPSAISRLQEIINDPEINVSNQLTAIKILLDSAQKGFETRTIERRLEKLEGTIEPAQITLVETREISPGEGGRAESKRNSHDSAGVPAKLPDAG